MSGEFLNQYVTHCRTCGRQIVMTQGRDGRWMPCETVMVRFTPSGGPGTFIRNDGTVTRGHTDRNGELGYIRHRERARAV